VRKASGYRQVPTFGSDRRTSSTGTLLQVVEQPGDPPEAEQKAKHLLPSPSPVTQVLPPSHSLEDAPVHPWPILVGPALAQSGPLLVM
jgi:hypothetical protein